MTPATSNPLRFRRALIVILVLLGLLALIPLGFGPYKWFYSFYSAWAGALVFVLYHHRLPFSAVAQFFTLVLIPFAVAYGYGHLKEIRTAEQLAVKYLGPNFTQNAKVTRLRSANWLDSFFEIAFELRGPPDLEGFEPVPACHLLGRYTDSALFKFEKEANELARNNPKPKVMKKIREAGSMHVLLVVVINSENTKGYFHRSHAQDRGMAESFGKPEVTMIGSTEEEGQTREEIQCTDDENIESVRRYRPDGTLRSTFERPRRGGGHRNELFYDPSEKLYQGKSAIDPRNKKFTGYYTMVDGQKTGPFEIRFRSNDRVAHKGVYKNNVLQDGHEAFKENGEKITSPSNTNAQ